MTVYKKGSIAELQWNEAREEIFKWNPQLCEIIDKLPLTKKHTFIKVRYPYGAKIVFDGKLHIVNAAGQVVHLADHSIPQHLKEKLGYSSVPTGFVTQNSAEVHFKMPDRVISLNLFTPGYLLGLWESLDPPAASYLAKRIWSVYAGARTIVMVPKITDAEAHAVLQSKFGVPRKLSKDLQDHWQIFTAIANHPNFKEEWYFEILFFPHAWFESIQKGEKAWKELENYFLKTGWAQSSYWRNKVTYDLVWEIFISSLSTQLVRPNPYDIYIVKHMALVGSGVLPGLKPATNNLTAPISALQDVFVNDYGLKQYIPTIMVPHHFSVNDSNDFVYYSLKFPTLLESSPKTRNYPSAMVNILEIKAIQEKFIEDAMSGALGIEGTPVYDFLKMLSVDYFHSEAGRDDGIRNSSEMAREDKDLVHYKNKIEGMRFSDKSRLFKGCIRLSHKKR